MTDGNGVLSWSTAASGDVYGPASATDNAVARYDGTTGKIIQNSAVTIADDGATVIAANSTTDGLRITQIGTGNALLVEDNANPDATPFVVAADGIAIQGYTTSITISGAAESNYQSHGTGATSYKSGNTYFGWSADTGTSLFHSPQLLFARSGSNTLGTQAVVSNTNPLGAMRFFGSDGTAFKEAAQILVSVDGTPGVNDMPGRLVFSTTADGASSPTERMRIDQAGRVGIGSVSTQASLAVTTTLPAASGFSQAFRGAVTYDPSVTTNSGYTFHSAPLISAGTLPTLRHFNAQQGTYTGSVTNQFGYFADSTHTGATNNYGFYSNIASGTGRYNFYANGTAENFFGGNTVVSVTDNTNAALRITQLGTGNALLVEDSTNPDATPTVITADGTVIRGYTSPVVTDNYVGTQGTPLIQTHANATTASGLASFVWESTAASPAPSVILSRSRSATIGSFSSVASGDAIGAINFNGDDGTAFVVGASITASVDGTPGTNDMPGRLVFSTTADGASSPTEALRISSAQTVSIGGSGTVSTAFYNRKNITGAVTAYANFTVGQVQSDVTSAAYGYRTSISTAATAYTLGELTHYRSTQSTIGAGSTVTNQFGFLADSSLTGATNNYGFYGNIASGTGRYNFYAAGTADNYFAGDMQLDKTVTAGGTTGAQTINKNAGTVNFAAAATSLVVTDSRVTTSSIIICTVGTNDTTLKSVAAVAGAGSFTLHASAAATAETRVNFLIIN